MTNVLIKPLLSKKTTKLGVHNAILHALSAKVLQSQAVQNVIVIIPIQLNKTLVYLNVKVILIYTTMKSV